MGKGNPSSATLRLKSFEQSLKDSGLFPLTSIGIKTFQINVGALCNQQCRHCHVGAGPERGELMTKDTMKVCLDVLKKYHFPFVDITGGAPEMNPNYRWFVERCLGETGSLVKTRTNLTILLKEGFTDLPLFLAENRVEVTASLPYYLSDVTDRMRGEGVHSASLKALQILNKLGYGEEGSGLILNLVFNPAGAYLPPGQSSIENDFKRELKKKSGIVFNSLFTITNMPVGRFLEFLRRSGNLKPYMERLAASYNPEAAKSVMCRDTLSVGWDGSLYDCDFNQMLSYKCNHGAPSRIEDFDFGKLRARLVVTGTHCYGCTAGEGSSCTGAVTV